MDPPDKEAGLVIPEEGGEVNTEAWMRSVHGRLSLGRLLPLGGPDDGTRITEQAAVLALRHAAAGIPGVRLESMRIGPAPHRPVFEAVVRPPASALPPGPLRIEAAFTGSVTQPLPEAAEQLRSTLLSTATEGLGLTTVAVDLRVIGLHEGPEAEVGSPSVENTLTSRRKVHRREAPPTRPRQNHRGDRSADWPTSRQPYQVSPASPPRWAAARSGSHTRTIPPPDTFRFSSRSCPATAPWKSPAPSALP